VVKKLLDKSMDTIKYSVNLPKEGNDEITDKYTGFNDSVGEWGGTCECPNSSTSYLVGSYYNPQGEEDCSKLACENGIPGAGCLNFKGLWSKKKVECGIVVNATRDWEIIGPTIFRAVDLNKDGYIDIYERNSFVHYLRDELDISKNQNWFSEADIFKPTTGSVLLEDYKHDGLISQPEFIGKLRIPAEDPFEKTLKLKLGVLYDQYQLDHKLGGYTPMADSLHDRYRTYFDNFDTNKNNLIEPLEILEAITKADKNFT
jgi:hypothetical protein